MNSEVQTNNQEEQLLKSLVQQVDETESPEIDESHLDDETIALFTLGGLAGEERNAVVQHLASCPTCRKTASAVISVQSEIAPAVRRDPQNAWRTRTALILTIVASVLVVVGLSLWFPRGERGRLMTEQQTYNRVRNLLDQGDFTKARTVLDKAKRQGIESDRLRSLKSQAIQEFPGPVALASTGRLPDFGYDIGGIVAREPVGQANLAKLQAAYDVLATAGNGDLGVLLNRGHIRLALGRPAEAEEDFRTATERAPSNRLAWLGLGLAHYLQNDFEAAESAFRKCLALDETNRAARLNLAMTLEERGEFAQALEIWKQLLDDDISNTDKAKIRQQVEELQQLFE